MSHFTYAHEMNNESLMQGDLIEITNDIKNVLSSYHAYFIKEQYKYFMVITQSCDLVKRSGSKCKSKYITLAAVRSYSDFIRKESKKYGVKTKGNTVFMMKNQENKFADVLRKLYNNNYPDYFFLAKDSDLGLDSNMVVYLKVSIALKSDEHFQKCLHAKKLELNEEFRAKLGWIVGNMYSRVGTADWTPDHASNSEFKEMIFSDIHEHFLVCSNEKYKALIKQVEEKGIDFSDVEQVMQEISNIEIPTKYDKVIGEIKEVLDKNLDTSFNKDNVIRDIESSPIIKALID